MSQTAESTIPALIDKNYQRLLDDWIACQKREGALRSGQIIMHDRLALALQDDLTNRIVERKRRD
jgi:hypothetical protein